MKTAICFVCLIISLNSWAQKKDTVPALFAPKVVFQECLNKQIPPDFYKGKFLILDFWATWCAPCIAGFPHVNQLADKYNVLMYYSPVIQLNPKTSRLSFLHERKRNFMPINYRIRQKKRVMLLRFGLTQPA